MVTVKDKMTLIQSIFIDSKEKGLSITNHSELNKALLSSDGEFISIAYEAASMGIAINSIKNNKVPSVSGIDGMRNLSVVLAMYESFKKKRIINLKY